MKSYQSMPGSFLAQGIVGGALGGFAYVFFITLWEGSANFQTLLAFTPVSMLLGSTTFKSPAKLILLFLGIGGNIPVFLGGWLAFSVYSAFSHAEGFLITGIICCAFLITWAIFLFARLTVDTGELIPLSIFPSILPSRSEDHENCDYGSSGFYRHTPDTSSRV